MNGKEIIDMIGVAVDDINHGVFSIALKEAAVNSAMNKIVGRLYPQYKTHLQGEKTDVEDRYDIMDLINVEKENIRGGVNCIREVRDQTSGRYAVKISFKEHTRDVNVGVGDSHTLPKYYIDGTLLRLIPNNMKATITYEINPGYMKYTETRPDVFIDEKFDGNIIDIATAILTRDKQAESYAYMELKKECSEYVASEKNRSDLPRRPKMKHNQLRNW